MDRVHKQRWRLALGRFADKQLASESIALDSRQQQQDQVLQKLYDKQLAKRDLHSGASLEDSQPQVFEWLAQTEHLFPASVQHKIQNHAIDEFGLTTVLSNPKILEKLTPSLPLLKQLLAVHNQVDRALMTQIKTIIHTVVEQLLSELKPRFQNRFSGRLNRHQYSPQPVLANLDWHKTIRHNLKYYDLEQRQLMVQRVFFNARNQRHFPWRVILCIDQSGSMMESMIFSAVIAGILAQLPVVDLKLVLFDTNVVDMSERATEPVEVLMSIQMGGGTHIRKAWQYCQQLTEHPQRTVVVTVSDFCEGASPSALIQQADGMLATGTKMLGLTALTARAEPFYDSHMTSALAAKGMELASLSPDQFADWLARVMEF